MHHSGYRQLYCFSDRVLSRLIIRYNKPISGMSKNGIF